MKSSHEKFVSKCQGTIYPPGSNHIFHTSRHLLIPLPVCWDRSFGSLEGIFYTRQNLVKNVRTQPPSSWLPLSLRLFRLVSKKPRGDKSTIDCEKISLLKKLHPRKLTWIPKMMVWKRWFLLMWPFLVSMLDF